MELLFILKNRLIKNYEDFFFIDRRISNEYAFQTIDENLTVINEANLFNSTILDGISLINEIKKSKNYAMPISMEFRHEKNGHMKKSLKNKNVLSPILYLKDGKVKKFLYEEINGEKKGESGKFIEKFIDDNPIVIKELKLVKIFGELLDYKLFIEKDFDKLKLKMNEIKNQNFNNDELIDFQMYLQKSSDKSEKEKKIELRNRRRKQLEKIGILQFGDVYITKLGKKLLDEQKKKKIYDPFKFPKNYNEENDK